MAHQSNDRRDHGDFGGHPGQGHEHDYSMMPNEDPAIINPDELATFPKTVKTDGYHNHYDNHSVSKRTPVRDGSYITLTDNHPEKKGFM